LNALRKTSTSKWHLPNALIRKHVKRIDEQHGSEFTPNLTGNHAIISCTGCTLKIEAMKRSKVSNHAIIAHGTTPEIQ
jgi:hypothetical protein